MKTFNSPLVINSLLTLLASNGHDHGAFLGSYPEAKPRIKTQADFDKLKKAEAKRIKKNLKRRGK